MRVYPVFQPISVSGLRDMYIGIAPPSYISSLPPYIVPGSVLIACAVAYQVASYPTGFMFQLLKLVEGDANEKGPRNLEECDIWRQGKISLAVATAVIDVVKVLFAIIAGIAFGALFLKSYIEPDPHMRVCIPELSITMLYLPPLASLLGQQYPLWMKFRGGKGFLTAVAIYFFLNPMAGFALGFVWLVTLAFSGGFTLAALLSMASGPLWGWLFARGVWLELPDVTSHFAYFSCAMAALVFIKHRDYLARLLRGGAAKG